MSGEGGNSVSSCLSSHVKDIVVVSTLMYIMISNSGETRCSWKRKVIGMLATSHMRDRSSFNGATIWLLIEGEATIDIEGCKEDVPAHTGFFRTNLYLNSGLDLAGRNESLTLNQG